MEVNASEVESFLEVKHECSYCNWVQLSACTSILVFKPFSDWRTFRWLLYYICFDLIKGFVWFGYDICTHARTHTHRSNSSSIIQFTVAHLALLNIIIVLFSLSCTNQSKPKCKCIAFVVSILEGHYVQIR